jgi:hypothetical protein
MMQTVATFVSTAERDSLITAPTTGQTCYVGGTGMQLYVAAGGWRTIVPEVPVTPVTTTSVSRYQAADTTQSIAQATWGRVKLGTVVASSGAWTSSQPGGAATGHLFTCNTPGRYQLSAFFHFPNAGAGARCFAIADGNSLSNNVAMSQWINNTTDAWASSLYGERSFAAGDTVALWVYSGTGAFSPNNQLLLPYLNIRSII